MHISMYFQLRELSVLVINMNREETDIYNLNELVHLADIVRDVIFREKLFHEKVHHRDSLLHNSLIRRTSRTSLIELYLSTDVRNSENEINAESRANRKYYILCTM